MAAAAWATCVGGESLARTHGDADSKKQVLKAPDSAEYAAKAFALKDRVSERERLYITERYDSVVIGSFAQTRDALELYIRTYPRDAVPHINLSVLLTNLGDHEGALVHAKRGGELDPHNALAYSDLIEQYTALGRDDEANAAVAHAVAAGSTPVICTACASPRRTCRTISPRWLASWRRCTRTSRPAASARSRRW